MTQRLLSPDEVRVSVTGWHTYDPIAGEYRWHPGSQILCWALDTDYDGDCFQPSQLFFSDQARHEKALRRLVGTDADWLAVDACFGLVSRPFKRPSSGRIAVRITTQNGQSILKPMTVSDAGPKPEA